MRFRTLPFALVLVAAAASLVLSLPSVVSAAPSPTGRSPRLIWTEQRQDVWNRMRADYLAGPGDPATLGGKWFKVVKENAECACRYGDTGLWATLMYQWTGEQRYVELAWNQLAAFVGRSVTDTSGNYVRENAIEFVILADWLWPGLGQQRQAQLTDALAQMLNHALTGNPWSQGYPMNDSDQLVGTYFGVVVFSLAFPTHPAAAGLFAHPQTGGLTPTAADKSTARNSINLYVSSLGEGGEWIESSEYNLGTVKLLLMGAEAVRTATRTDPFPEITRWTPRWAERQMAFWTPDLTATYQWGDVEHPREMTAYSWTNANGLTAGLLQGTIEGAQLQGQLLELVAKYGAVGYGSMEPAVTGRLFLTFNPYAPTSEWRGKKSFYAAGAGLLLQKSGFDQGDSLFAAHFAPRRNRQSVEHQVRYTNDFELWRNGEWVLTHPRGYAGAANTGDGTNTVLMHGFGDMLGFKEVTAHAMGDTFAFLQGTTGGASVPAPYWDPPPIFVHEWTRSVLYIAGTTDTVVVFDRTHVDNEVPRRDRYYPADLAVIDKATTPKQWLLHMPVSPTIGQSDIGWSTPGGQRVRWTPLLPLGSRKVIHDEAAMAKTQFGWGSEFLKQTELKYHVRVTPAVAQPWDTFLNVLQIGTPGLVTLKSVAGQVEGAHLTRPGQSDVLALFNATPSHKLTASPFEPSNDVALSSAHLRSTGFTMSWSAQSGTTEVFVADLDNRRQWTLSIDGVSVNGFAPSAGGFASFTVNGSGNHSLRLDATGAASVPPAAPTGLRLLP